MGFARSTAGSWKGFAVASALVAFADVADVAVSDVALAVAVVAAADVADFAVAVAAAVLVVVVSAQTCQKCIQNQENTKIYAQY